MKLYHYTSVPLAEAIMSTALKHGHMNTMRGIVHNVVWLTSDPTSEGHGLLTGDEKNLTLGEIQHMEAVQGGPLRNTFMQKKTAVRLTYVLPADWTYIVQNYVEYCRGNEGGELFAKTTGLSCFVDITNASDKRLKSLMKTVKTKEQTWWISFTPIPSAFVAAIDIKTDKGYVPYSFEPYGRRGLEDVGFFCPPPSALQQLQHLLTGLHPFEQANARVLCADPVHEPTVAIRGGGTERILAIRDGRLVRGADQHLVAIQNWVSVHREALLECWSRAEKSYRAFYPAKD